MNQRKKQVTKSWRLDETYIKVSGKGRIINIGKRGANTADIKTWNKRSFTRKKIKVRRVKYLNNIVEQDHRSIKRRIVISTGFMNGLNKRFST